MRKIAGKHQMLGRCKEGFFPSLQRELGIVNTLITDFWPLKHERMDP